VGGALFLIAGPAFSHRRRRRRPVKSTPSTTVREIDVDDDGQ